MSINRNNYEEFFLLNADGELSPLETEMVNQFVQFHPDLKEELDILMDCKLVADVPVVFPKEKLYKQTIWDAENISQTQMQMLLLLDNELMAKDKETLQKNIDENTILQQEWNILQQAKLPDETIAHPYKKPLYKIRKIATLGWLRWTAAAAIILGLGLFLLNKNIGANQLVILPTLAKNVFIGKQQKVIAVLQPKMDQKNNHLVGDKLNSPNNKTTNKEKIIAVSVKTIKKNTDQRLINMPAVGKNNVEENVDQEIASNSQIDDNADRTPLITRKIAENIGDYTKVKPANAKFKVQKSALQLAALKPIKQPSNIDDAQTDVDDNEYVHIAGANIKKQKIRSVFRGVFRGIGRTFSNSRVEAASTVALNNE